MDKKNIVTVIIILAVIIAGYFVLTIVFAPRSSTTDIIVPQELEVLPPEEGQALPQEIQAPSEISEITNPESEVREINVAGKEFSYNPSSITLKHGEKVRIIFSNAGSARHDFVIEGLGIRTKVIGPGQADTVEFTAPEPGTYVFFCSVAGHRAAGMAGEIIVE